MYVAPSKQNMGIGSEILTRLEEYASERVQKEIGEWKVHGYSLLYRPTLDFYSKRDYDIFPDEMTLWGQDGFLLPSVPVRKRSFQTR
jgi:GNAT superfamily N-acetyltransferase